MKYLLLLVACLSLACGGSDTAPTPVTAVIVTPPPFTQTVTGTVSAFGTVYHPLQIPRAGQLTLTLTWADPAVDLDLYLASPNCTALYPFAACGILAASDSATGVREAIARTVTIGEAFNVFVDNVHLTRAQSYSIAVLLQ